MTVSLRTGCCLAVGVVVAAGAPAAADGRVRALAVGEVSAGPVLAGDRVLWGESRLSSIDASSSGMAFRLRSVSLAGGRTVTVVRRRVDGADPTWLALDASPFRAALALASRPRDPRIGRPREAFALAGPPGGPFALVAGSDSPERATPEALHVEVADDTVVAVERSPDRVVVHRPAAPPAELAPPAEAEAAGLVAEGGFIAFPVRRSEDDPRGDEVVVAELATGAVRYRVAVRGGLLRFDLQADGKVAVLGGGDRLAWASPAEPRLHRLRVPATLRPEELQVAADRIVVRATGPPVPTGGSGTSADRLLVVDLQGRAAAVTPRTVSLRGVGFDGRRLAWSASGCVLVSDLRGRPPAAIPRGPCPRVETVVEDLPPVQLSPRRRAVPASLTCISAAGGRCRGEVRLLIDDRRRRDDSAIVARAPYRLLAGRRGSVHLTVPVRWLPRLRRGAAVRIEARTRDPQGRISLAAGTTFLSARVLPPGPSTARSIA